MVLDRQRNWPSRVQRKDGERRQSQHYQVTNQPAFFWAHLDGAGRCPPFPHFKFGWSRSRQQGSFEYNEGWHEWNGKGKYEEDCFEGHAGLHLFAYLRFERWAVWFQPLASDRVLCGKRSTVVKDTIWNARLGSLRLKARKDIPVAGIVFNVVNDALQVEHPPNCWSTSVESGWQEYRDKADKTFDAIVSEMVGTAFHQIVFEGAAVSQAFEWRICMEHRWVRRNYNFRSMWTYGSGQGVGNRAQPRSDYFACLMRGDDTQQASRQHKLLEMRQSAATQLGMHMYGFRVTLKDTFAAEDLDQAINQLR